MKTIKLIISSSILILSCTDHKHEVTNKIYFSEFAFNKKLRSNPIVIDTELTYPQSIELINEKLIIYDGYSSSGMIKVFDIRSNAFINTLVPNGNGPGELLNISSIFNSSNYIYFHDLQSQKLLRFDLYSALTKGIEPKPFILKTVIGSSLSLRVMPLGDSAFLSSLMPALNNRYVVSRSGNFDTLYSFGKYPLLNKEDEINNSPEYLVKVPGNLFQNKLSVSSEKLIAAYPYVPLIEVFNIKSGQKEFDINGPENKDSFEYVITPDGYAIPCSDCNYQYSAIRASDDYIFLLYSGEKFKPDSHLSKYLFQFDMKGNPICSYELDYPISDFTIDLENNKIYGVSPNLDSPILEFTLNLSN